MKYVKSLGAIERLYIVYAIIAVVASLAHPITPNLMMSLNMPNYMFGVAFSAMALTNFAMSPFWGNLNNYVSSRKIMALCMIGYSVGQAVFGFGGTKITIIVGRMIAGVFISGMNVTAVFYVLTHSNEESKGDNVTRTITLFTVFGTLGYLIGGLIGTISLNYVMGIQSLFLLLCGVLSLILLEEQNTKDIESVSKLIKLSNPVQSFFEIGKYLNIKIFLLFVAVFFATFASTSLSQNYQYYIQNFLGLSSAMGGLTRSIVGLFAVVLNFTVTRNILRRNNVEKSVTHIYTFLILTLFILNIFKETSIIFTLLGIVLMVVDTVQVSLLQDRNAAYSSKENQGIMAGMHNSMKSLGMIGGSLLSGFLYDVNPIYPFLMALGFYGLSLFVTLILSNRMISKEAKYENTIEYKEI